MKAGKIIYHPDGDADDFQTVEATLDALRGSRVTGPSSSTDNALVRYDGTTGKLVQNSVVTVSDTGDINTNGGDLTVDDITADDIAAQDGAFSATLTKGGVSVATVTQTVGASFVFKAPEDETVYLILKCPFAWTITDVTTRTEVGTSTVTIKIDGNALGGSANSASTSESTQSHSSSNAVSADQDVTVTFASTSSDCENLAITLKGTRTLA